MNEVMRNAIHLVLFVACYAVMYGIAVIVRRAKQDSPRWRQRSEVQQRVLSRIPGALVAFALYAAVLFLVPFN